MTNTPAQKPLGIKNYGSIAHLPGSRLGPGDHKCHEGQEKIATVKVRDRHDQVLVQEKLDGSNVGVALVSGQIYALSRAGYVASTSKYEQHRAFDRWVHNNTSRFRSVLREGERLAGEWLMQAHGTRYALKHEPFVAFDIMVGAERLIYDAFVERVRIGDFMTPHLLHRGGACSIDAAMTALETYGFHGAIDPVEGAVWRVERNEFTHPGSSERRWIVDYLVKYVRPDKVDGAFLPEVTGSEAVYNWHEHQ